mgnify:CR=1 FL=1
MKRANPYSDGRTYPYEKTFDPEKPYDLERATKLLKKLSKTLAEEAVDKDPNELLKNVAQSLEDAFK